MSFVFSSIVGREWLGSILRDAIHFSSIIYFSSLRMVLSVASVCLLNCSTHPTRLSRRNMWCRPSECIQSRICNLWLETQWSPWQSEHSSHCQLPQASFCHSLLPSTFTLLVSWKCFKDFSIPFLWSHLLSIL